MRRILLVLAACSSIVTTATAENPLSGPPIRLPGLHAAAEIVRDTNGIAHIHAAQELDLYFLQGWVHAEDRLFQMDLSRRRASGTLAELLGPAVLADDVQLRTLGLRRAAARSLPLLSPRAQAALEAYAAGVNASTASRPLPPEYGVLELSQVEPWTPLDSVVVAKLITFGLSSDLDDIQRSVALGAYVAALGPPAGVALFGDLFRTAPFDPAATIPDASVAASAAVLPSAAAAGGAEAGGGPWIDPGAVELGRRYLDRVKEIPILRRLLDGDRRGGSNEWAVSGRHTESGFPLLANDPHLALDVPSTFYPIHLRTGGLNVVGASFPGIIAVVAGHNQRIAWGATWNPLDVTDVYLEQLVPDPTSPSRLSTRHATGLELVVPIPEIFRTNVFDGVPDNVTVVPPGGGIPPITLIVPRRNQGPIIQLRPGGQALSVQYTGFSGTRELDTFLIWNEAKGLDDFVHGLQFFDVGSQNWAYADVDGNIAYFTSAEMPIREDLQAGAVAGAPPFFIRNGFGGNEWLPVQNPQPGQAIPYEILPADEMPRVVNPPAGFFVNANNDPAGTTLDNDSLNQLRPGGGIYYLNNDYRGFRAGRVTQRIRAKLDAGQKMSFADMQAIQADTALIDAQVFVPYILGAFAGASGPGAHPTLAALAADARVAEAVGRLAGWDHTTPTGIPEGYDASDLHGTLFPPSAAEIQASVAATIYAVWRGQFIQRTIDAALDPLPKPDGRLALTALRHLIESDPPGVGASGVDFFAVPGVASAVQRRDILLLASLQAGLDRLAGPPFAAGFGGSTDQDDYRWGRLHRIVLDHPLGGPFSIPPAGGAFPPPLPGLPGIPTDGGFETVDAAAHDARGDSAGGFTFGNGPVHRFVSEAAPGHMRAESSLPGGVRGVPGSPFYANLLPGWLTNDTFPLPLKAGDVAKHAASSTKFVPAE